MDLKNVDLIRVGKWNASTGPVNVTSGMLDDIVASFASLNNKVTGFGVPVKLGHRTQVGQEAMGWLSEIARVDDTLVGDFTDVPPAIVDAVKEHRYNSVSVEIRPAVEYDGKTYPNVLSGVALLGAEWPAVKGLRPLSASKFAEEGDKIELTFEEQETVNFTQEQHDAILNDSVAKAKTETAALSAKTISDLEAKVAEQTARAEKAETANRMLAENGDKSEVKAIIEAAEKDGKITPAMKPTVQALADVVTAATDPAKRKDALKALSDFVKSLAPKVTFGEKGSSKQNDEVEHGQKASDLADEKARELMKQDTKLSYADAINKVFASDPDLLQAYAEE